MSALAKLEQVLPARLRPQWRRWARPRWSRGTGFRRWIPAVLAVLAACCRDLEIVAFSYSNAARRASQPPGRAASAGRPSTGGGTCSPTTRTATDWRTLPGRPDLSDVAPTRHHFDGRDLPAADAASYLAESFAAASYRYTALLTVELSADAVGETFFGGLPGTIMSTGPASASTDERRVRRAAAPVRRRRGCPGRRFTLDGLAGDRCAHSVGWGRGTKR